MRTNFLKYEQQESVAVSRFLDPELDVVELGAGIGFVSCLVNSKLSEAATHVAVEANPKLIESLERNRELNDATFDIHHAAYSPTDSSVGLNVYDDFRSTGVFDKKGKTGREVTVAGVNLASIVRQYDIDHFTLVADIEGVEADLLLEEWGTISQKCETLIVEFHDRNPNTSLARSKLTDSDFECLYTNSDVEVWSR
jgi:FkbM family methyltransferase